METTEKNMEHGEHFNESIVNEVILEDMKKNRIDHMKYLPGMETMEESDVSGIAVSGCVASSGGNRAGCAERNQETFWEQCVYVYPYLYCKLL